MEKKKEQKDMKMEKTQEDIYICALNLTKDIVSRIQTFLMD